MTVSPLGEDEADGQRLRTVEVGRARQWRRWRWRGRLAGGEGQYRQGRRSDTRCARLPFVLDMSAPWMSVSGPCRAAGELRSSAAPRYADRGDRSTGVAETVPYVALRGTRTGSGGIRVRGDAQSPTAPTDGAATRQIDELTRGPVQSVAPRTSASPARVGSPACEVPSTQLPRSAPTWLGSSETSSWSWLSTTSMGFCAIPRPTRSHPAVGRTVPVSRTLR